MRLLDLTTQRSLLISTDVVSIGGGGKSHGYGVNNMERVCRLGIARSMAGSWGGEMGVRDAEKHRLRAVFSVF